MKNKGDGTRCEGNGNGNNKDCDADRDDNNGNGLPLSQRPIPTPEAFQRVNNNLPSPLDPNSNHNDIDKQSGNGHRNQAKVAAASGAPLPMQRALSMPAPQRPSLLIRRQSSLFGQLPVRSKSRLFGDMINFGSNQHATTNSHNNNTTIAAETIMASTTTSQSTWLQDDHQSTLLGGGSQIPSLDESNLRFNHHQSKAGQQQQQRQPQQAKSSLFGAVMRQFGSGISSTFPMSPSSPFSGGKKRSSNASIYAGDDSPQSNNNNNNNTTSGGGALRSLIASPSGKTIMNIVNQFNSPFKFQSPNSSDKKRRGRQRRLWKDDDDDSDDDSDDDRDKIKINKDNTADDVFTTPTKRRRMRLDDDDDENSKPTSNNLFPDHDNNDSRSSLGGGIVDENWREAPIVVDANPNPNTNSTDATDIRMEFLDWSLPTKLRIEVHGGTPRQKQTATRTIVHSWIRDVMRDNEEAITYWTYNSPSLPTHDNTTGDDTGGSTGRQQDSGFFAQNNSNAHLSVLQKSIATTKSAMSRQDSFGSNRFDTKLQNGKRKTSVNKSNADDDNNDAVNAANRLVKYLIKSVRGPRAKYSRKRVLEEHCYWDEQATTGSTSTLTQEYSKERLQRQWKQAIRSLFSNYRRNTMQYSNRVDYVNARVLDTYFYCIGQDHSVLFRVAAANNSDGDEKSDTLVPVVLVSSTSQAFRKLLERKGLDMNYDNNNKSGDEGFQFLESIQEREARERKKIATAVQKSKRLFNKAILSPGVKADLEALRRAQAFGESAGADVMVKVKSSNPELDDEGKRKEILPKAVRISGWDNVSLFFEVYWNQFGDVMETTDEGVTENGLSIVPKSTNKRLPLLICPNTKDIGPFEHASMKRLRFFPTENAHAADSNIHTDNDKGNASSASHKNVVEEGVTTNHSNGMDIRGILLPCTIRKLLLLARNQILEDDKQFSALNLAAASDCTKQINLGESQQKDEPDTSRYVVLHSMRSRPTTNSKKQLPKSFIEGLSGTVLFNQGKKKKKILGDTNKNGENQNPVFECTSGKVVSMAVWDISREEVAACKLDNAFPDNWFNNTN